MEQIEEMIYMTAAVGFFIVAVSILLYTGRCVDGLYEAYLDVEVPQETIVEVVDE